MKPSDTETRTDGKGGAAESSIFGDAPERDIKPKSRKERWLTWIDLWIVAPGRIMLGDTRTRIGGAVILFFLVMGTAGVVLIEPPVHNQGERFVPWFQTLEHPLGTESQGQDVLSLTVHSTPAMLIMMGTGGVFATSVGTVTGTLAGYKRGTIERVILTCTDIVMTIPGLPLLIVLAVALEPRDPLLVGLLLSINAWAGLARSIHSQVLALRSESYVESSRVLGLGSGEIIRDDILPNLMPYIMINFMNTTISVLSASVGLYFLGVLPFTHQNWGVMINLAYQGGALQTWAAAHWIIVPILTISLIGFGVTLFAQGMDRVFNPQVRARQSAQTPETTTEL